MSRRKACWAYRGKPGPRPCPERRPGPRRPTEPAVGESEGRTLSRGPIRTASVAAASETDPGLSEPTDNEIPPKRQAAGYRTGMEGPTGEERTAPTSSTRVLGARSGQSSPSRPDSRGSERGGALRQSPSARGRKAALAPQGPAAGGPGTEGRAERTHHGGWRGPFKAAGGRFAAGPWLGHHLGEGGGNAGGGGCSAGSAQPEPSASPRLLYKPARNNES